jgi:hypothetical protein
MKALRLSLVLLVTGCMDASAPGDQANSRISIVNNDAALASRVTYFDDSIPVDSTGVGYPTAPIMPSGIARSSAASQAAFTIKLKAEVAPPVVSGQTLQATSVSIVGNLAIVSYNMVGNPYVGAIEVIDITNKSNPVLTSEAVFQNTDINAVSTFGTSVYVAEATGDTGFLSPAVFEVMQLSGNNLVLNGNRRMGLSSFVGTSTTASATRAYATSGDNGALFIINPATFTLVDSIHLHDARWVALGNGKIVVAQGTPGQISVFNESTLAPVGTWSFTGATIAESKSTVLVVGSKAFIAAGTGGVQVLSVNSGALLGSVPRPSPDSLGLDSSVVVTNAAALDQDLLFISNGEAGVYVAQGSQAFSATADVAQTITMRGRLRFGNLQSVNHVAYSAGSPGQPGMLIIAAGLGGLKIVQVN